MKAGDQFIRYSNSGESPIRGIIKKVWTTYSYDLRNRVRIKKEMLQATTGIKYEANECYEVESEISFNFMKKLKEIFSKKK